MCESKKRHGVCAFVYVCVCRGGRGGGSCHTFFPIQFLTPFRNLIYHFIFSIIFYFFIPSHFFNDGQFIFVQDPSIQPIQSSLKKKIIIIFTPSLDFLQYISINFNLISPEIQVLMKMDLPGLEHRQTKSTSNAVQ